MGLMDFIKSAFGGKKEIDLATCIDNWDSNANYKTLIQESSINLIAKTIARSHFQTFTKGIEQKGTNYYLFNVEANKNTSASTFWRETVEKLLRYGEALIIVQDNQLFLIDSFTRKEYAFMENSYTDLVIGDYLLSDIKKESQVLYLKDDNEKLRVAINGIHEDYSSLIKSSKKGYMNSKSRKGILGIDTNYPKTIPGGKSLKEHIQELLSDFMDPEKDAVFPQTKGLEYEEIDKAKGSKSNDSGRETKNFIDDVFDFIAISYGIPPSLLKGDTVDTKDAVNNFLTFCINPIAKLITDEINRKMYGKDDYLQNTYAKMDTSNIKAVDIRDIANSLELLTRTGSNTIDDNLRALGREPVGGKIGSSRYITKNLELIDKVLEGGD